MAFDGSEDEGNIMERSLNAALYKWSKTNSRASPDLIAATRYKLHFMEEIK